MLKKVKRALFLSVFTLVAARVQPLLAAEAGVPLKSGYRGISLSFDSDRVYYISPGDMVDVIAVYGLGADPSAAGNDWGAATVLKMNTVLAVGRSAARPGQSVVQLQVEPLGGEYLETFSHSGDLWLSLRKKGDIEDNPMQLSTWRKLLETGLTPLLPAQLPLKNDEAVKQGQAADKMVRASVLASVESRMREAFPALSLSIASDKVMFVRPGDRIDVLATIDGGRVTDAKKQKITITVLQNILVLDNRRSEAHPGQNVLLLALNFAEVQSAALAADTSDIQVMLREKSDTEVHAIDPALLDKMR